MVITTQEIKDILTQLEDDLFDREQAQDWAIKCRNEFDAGRLTFSPLVGEEMIWNALQFIELYAEKIAPEIYLYSKEDLSIFIRKGKWNN